MFAIKYRESSYRSLNAWFRLPCQFVSAARLAESERRKGERGGGRKTREWSSAKMTRESEVLILLRGGHDPCYFSQRHNPPLSFRTWPGSYFIGKCANTRRSRIAFPHFDDFLSISRIIISPYFSASFFNTPGNFITTKLGPMKQRFDVFCFVKLVFPCVNKKRYKTKR